MASISRPPRQEHARGPGLLKGPGFPFSVTMNRVLFLIDGFNVYHSLLTKKYSKYKWLDYSALAQHFIKPATDIITKILFLLLIPIGT